MRQRLVVDAEGRLVDREGQVVGRILGLTVELGLGVRGVDADTSTTTAVESSSNVQEALLPPGGVGESDKPADDVARVWAHYQAVIPGGKRYQIDSKRRSIIRSALKVRPMEQVLRAIDGLAASPHHNGQNDRRTKYLAINYALQGIGAQSNDERIDDMAAKASPSADGTISAVPSGQREMVRNRQRQVEDKLLHPGDATRAARAGDSERILREQYGLRAYVDGNGAVQWLREAGL